MEPVVKDLLVDAKVIISRVMSLIYKIDNEDSPEKKEELFDRCFVWLRRYNNLMKPPDDEGLHWG